MCKKVCDVYIKGVYDSEFYWVGTIRYANYDELNHKIHDVKIMYSKDTEIITKER